MNKLCAHCGLSKYETKFNKDRSRADGLDTTCRECRTTMRGLRAIAKEDRARLAEAAAKDYDALQEGLAESNRKVADLQLSYNNVKLALSRMEKMVEQKNRTIAQIREHCVELRAEYTKFKRTTFDLWEMTMIVTAVSTFAGCIGYAFGS